MKPILLSIFHMPHTVLSVLSCYYFMNTLQPCQEIVFLLFHRIKKVEIHFWSLLMAQNVFKIKTQAKITNYYILMKYPEERVKK